MVLNQLGYLYWPIFQIVHFEAHELWEIPVSRGQVSSLLKWLIKYLVSELLSQTPPNRATLNPMISLKISHYLSKQLPCYKGPQTTALQIFCKVSPEIYLVTLIWYTDLQRDVSCLSLLVPRPHQIKLWDHQNLTLVSIPNSCHHLLIWNRHLHGTTWTG